VRRLVAALTSLAALAACGSKTPPPPPLPPEGPLAMLVIESPDHSALEVKGPRPGELPPDRRDARGEFWRIPTLYGGRADVPGALLEAVLESGARVTFPSPAEPQGASELVVRRDPQGGWHVLLDPAPSAPSLEAHGVTGLRLRVNAGAKGPDHGVGGRRGTGGGRGTGAMDGSGGGRGGR
jgi:hypothetical protein